MFKVKEDKAKKEEIKAQGDNFQLFLLLGNDLLKRSEEAQLRETTKGSEGEKKPNKIWQ